MKRFIILCIISIFLTGCGAETILGPIATGFIMWQEGEAHKYYKSDSGTVHRAVKRTLEDMGLSISRDDLPDQGDYYVIAGNNNRFKIKIVRIEKNITKLSVRINFMGDKDYAELFYKNVDYQTNIIEYHKRVKSRNKRRLFHIVSN